jgi:hypothetical protein
MWHYLVKLAYTPLIPIIAVAADAASALTSTWSPLLNTGAIGCVLVWVLVRLQPSIGRMERAIDRGTRGNLVLALVLSDIAEGRDVSEIAKSQAKDLIKEIDNVADNRNA